MLPVGDTPPPHQFMAAASKWCPRQHTSKVQSPHAAAASQAHATPPSAQHHACICSTSAAAEQHSLQTLPSPCVPPSLRPSAPWSMPPPTSPPTRLPSQAPPSQTPPPMSPPPSLGPPQPQRPRAPAALICPRRLLRSFWQLPLPWQLRCWCRAEIIYTQFRCAYARINPV